MYMSYIYVHIYIHTRIYSAYIYGIEHGILLHDGIIFI